MVSRINSPKVLSPDGSSRFLVMLKLIQTLFKEERKSLTILDVGGGSPYMTHILEDLKTPYEHTTIDILPRPKGLSGKYIQGDATQMSFDDNTFDLVVSTDVLEHIPIDKKKAFINECIRVAKDYIIIAAPFNTEGVDYAEHLTNDLNKKLFKQGQVWLEEHFEYQKPEVSMVEAIIKKHKLDFELIGTNNLNNWVLATHTNLIEAKHGLNKKKLIDNNSEFNDKILTSGDMTGPFYRHFFVIFKKKLTTKQRKELTSIRTQSVDYKSNLKYVHNLTSAVSDRIAMLRKEVSEKERLLQSANQKIDNLQQELSAKEAIIESCRPYLTLLNLGPRTIVRKFIKHTKRQ
ncbi:MAG: methyltransferase domain-containing protein [Candidatus Microsaccharimonas sp.]